MRETLARLTAVLCVTTVAILSVVFAADQNRDVVTQSSIDQTPEGPTPAVEDDARAQIDRGRAVYQSLGCARCHSIAGTGSRRAPLDGVGARLSREELLAWAFGLDSVSDSLSPATLRQKVTFRRIDPDDAAALSAYLSTLTSGP